MPGNVESSKQRKEVFEQVRSEFQEQSDKWYDVIKTKRHNQAHVAMERTKAIEKKLIETYGEDVLRMDVSEFTRNFKEKPEVQTETVPLEIGNHTMQAVEDMDYLLNASHHDPEVKAIAFKLQQALKKK